ncbi:hypothetical protein ASPVEDRAFT_439315 [Aspergillus versicolor CBS 583.65]|uniref:Uncharacterized protein n=1 Tax=Aspergillus versicolor CBS 583.65 TaxID=1036611 RepID=A0A1L9P8U5_ASPVE|nr:uncharacterized protein ASPVEDRAFT_439315 [Aspergillus versicolor CBS 583.65]OJI97937.1 hypothetical protein ASPVEDRAFT_439315 [Aspergillus versicolor CBS 583.65]
MDRFSQPSKPNTRIPPILIARQNQALEQTTKANVVPQDQFSRLASLSKHRLYREAQTGDPDLRRCIGHHQLLCRTIMEAKDGMKRYLEDVLESESDSDSESDDEDEVLYEKGPIAVEYPQTDEDEDVDEGLLFPPTKQPQPQPQPQQQQQQQLSTTTTTTTITTNNDPPSPCVKEKIFGVVKGLVRRRSPSRTVSPALDEKTSPLIHLSEKNLSCTSALRVLGSSGFLSSDTTTFYFFKTV